MTTLKHVPTDLEFTGDTANPNILAANFQQDDPANQSMNNGRQESSEGDRCDIQDFENIYVNLGSMNNSPNSK